jgi:hypothetical protein
MAIFNKIKEDFGRLEATLNLGDNMEIVYIVRDGSDNPDDYFKGSSIDILLNHIEQYYAGCDFENLPKFKLSIEISFTEEINKQIQSGIESIIKNRRKNI